MLKYIIALSIISFCDSDTRTVADYDQLVLVQNSPISSFFMLLRYISPSPHEILAYITNHLFIFNPRKWIVQGLWAVDSNGIKLENCETSLGLRPTYTPESLNDNFKENLKIKWPAVKTNETEEELWETEFNTYGSCVTYSPWIYFNAALLLIAEQNIGSIVGRYGIVPGKSYALDSIVHSIEDALKARFYIQCQQDQNTGDQFLSQIQICFNISFKLMNCTSSGIYDCDSNRTVIYPGNQLNRLFV